MYPRYDPTGLSVISAPKTMLSVSYYDAEERVIATATAFPRFTSPDPLAETKCWNSGYIFCGDDPINFIDPTGLDEYEITEKGYLFQVIPNKEHDAIYIVDGSYNRIYKSATYQYGTLDANMNLTFQPDIGVKQDYSYILIKDFYDARSLFEFFALYTNVEWSHCYFSFATGDRSNVLTSSHKQNNDRGMDFFLSDNKDGKNIAKISKLIRHTYPSIRRTYPIRNE